MSELYKIAMELAKDLAEESIADDARNMMIDDASAKAHHIREKSDANESVDNVSVQTYRQNEYVIYGVIARLLDGYHGYKLVRE